MNRHSKKSIPLAVSFFVWAAFALSGCDSDLVKENVPELITKVSLTFTPASGTPVIVTATDPDGNGVQPIAADGPINLIQNTSYTLSISLLNALAAPSDPDYNIGDQVQQEGDEHLFFFAWTNDIFSNPTGNGNIDNRSDSMNYNDEDVNGLPLGLSTKWTTGNVIAGASFRIVLKHQPDIKSATSTSADGETDLDQSFVVNIE